MLAVCLFVVCRPKLLVLRSSCCLFASVLPPLALRGADACFRSAGEGVWRNVWRRRRRNFLLSYSNRTGRARFFGRRFINRVRNYVPFFFSALFNFSTSEVPGSPPSTSLARQALGHRCHARIASATLFLFGGVFTELALSFAAAATESMAAPRPGRRRTTSPSCEKWPLGLPTGVLSGPHRAPPPGAPGFWDEGPSPGGAACRVARADRASVGASPGASGRS